MTSRSNFSSVTLSSLRKVFSDPLYLFLGISLGVNLLVLYYLIFLQTTTFAVFFNSNNAFYNWASITLALLNGILFGIAVSMFAYILKKRKENAGSSGGGSFFGAVFGAISSSCPVCGSFILPALGIAGSLTAFPFQGLEVKLLSIGLLLFAIWESSKSIAGVCAISKEKILSWDKTHFVLNISRKTLPQAKSTAIIVLSILLVYALPNLPSKYKLSFTSSGSGIIKAGTALDASSGIDTSALFAQVNPANGYTVDASFGGLGPKLISAGAIDLTKFKQIYERSGRPLSEKQLAILTEGSNEKITINEENSYFLINFLWAFGLANKNPILDEGQMTKYGQNQIGSFASTGGWSLGSKEAMDIYSKSRLILLTDEQQAVVDEAANGTYRPCCGNSTAFPDCNHGMAMLGLYELMASQGAGVNELFEAGKYFNAFWFPQQYLDIATYFKAKEGVDFKDAKPRLVVGNDFSSGEGWTRLKKWLSDNNLVEKAPSGGGGCGV